MADFYFQYRYKNKGQDPDWFLNLDAETKKVLSFESVMNNEDDFPFHLRFSPLIYAGINHYVIENTAMFEDISRVFHLWRLTYIKQLSLLRDPESATRVGADDFFHTRYEHSFDVLAVANLLGTNAQLSKEDLMIFQIAAVSHDFRTPAGGDVTKLIDPEAFDEDKHYNEIFETEEWKTFAKKYSISKQQAKLYDTVQGKGVLGELLDVADKLAYVARDTDMYLNKTMRVFHFNGMVNGVATYDGGSSIQVIKSALESNPLVYSLWDSVEVVNGQVVIANTEKLTDFLKFRALLFKELYYNYSGRFSVYMFAKKVIKHLYDSGQLTPERLLEVGDFDLMMDLDKFLGSPFLLLAKPEVVIEECENREEALKKEIDSLMDSPTFVNVYIITLKDLNIPESHRAKVKEIFKI